MIENEFKIMLTAEQYERICAAFEWDSVFSQTNHYYDTPALEFSQRHITCRVRTKGEGAALQIKFPYGGAGFSRVELEHKLPEVPQRLCAQLLSELVRDYMDALPEAEHIGELTTQRRVKRFDGVEMDLDKSDYFSRTDYELELEFTDEAAARELRRKLQQLADLPESGDVCPGKVRRFIEEYKRQR